MVLIFGGFDKRGVRFEERVHALRARPSVMMQR
jgi:hypothetical protein